MLISLKEIKRKNTTFFKGKHELKKSVTFRCYAISP